MKGGFSNKNKGARFTCGLNTYLSGKWFLKGSDSFWLCKWKKTKWSLANFDKIYQKIVSLGYINDQKSALDFMPSKKVNLKWWMYWGGKILKSWF